MNLTHKFLVSLPTITGGTFNKSVIYIDNHTGDGASGWIINKQLSDDSVTHRLRKGMRLAVDIPIFMVAQLTLTRLLCYTVMI